MKKYCRQQKCQKCSRNHLEMMFNDLNCTGTLVTVMLSATPETNLSSYNWFFCLLFSTTTMCLILKALEFYRKSEKYFLTLKVGAEKFGPQTSGSGSNPKLFNKPLVSQNIRCCSMSAGKNLFIMSWTSMLGKASSLLMKT